VQAGRPTAEQAPRRWDGQTPFLIPTAGLPITWQLVGQMSEISVPLPNCVMVWSLFRGQCISLRAPLTFLFVSLNQLKGVNYTSKPTKPKELSLVAFPTRLFLFLCLSFPEVKNSCLRENVVVHEVSRALGVHQNDGGRGGEGAEVEGEVCLPAGVDDERVHRAAQALRHHESRRQPGFQGLWCSNPQRLSIKVGGII